MSQQKKSCENIEKYNYFMVDTQFLPQIMSNIYSNPEIFLRELISNSSDALDKINYTSPNETNNTEELCIRIILDKKNRTLTVIDNGIGMNRSQLTDYLGLIARSGTKAFKEKTKTCNWKIGQFGIGFYSVFLVADKVTVTIKSHNQNQFILESNSKESFTMKYGSDQSLKRGTKVMLNIKENKSKYLEEKFIKEIVKKYFQLIKYPIKLLVQKKYEKKLNENETKEQENITKESIDIDDAEYEVIHKVEHLFTSITEEKNVCVFRVTVTKPLKFEAKLWIPHYTSYELLEEYAKNNKVKLFVRNVLITDNCKELMPNYLNFVRAIICSEDLTLHISREKLQCSKTSNYIRSHIETNCLAVFEYMMTNKGTRYKKFYKNYGRNIKMGICEDSIYREKLIKLLIYHTSASGSEVCSLKDYVDRMKQNQKYIYFITGESIKQVENNVLLEALKMRDIEVIYMIDPIDEFVVHKIKNFDGKPLMSVVRADLEFFENEAEKMKRLQKAAQFEKLCEIMQKVLNDKVEKVVVSNRLVTSPCCIVNSRCGWTANMERFVKTQFLYKIPTDYSMAKKQFEINPDNDIIQNLLTIVKSKDFNARIEEYIITLYGAACISSGFILEKSIVLNNIIDHVNNILS